MKKFHLPFVNLPQEFLQLLKSNLSVTSSPAPVFDIIRPNKALYAILERAFKEFDDGRGVEKVMLALGWQNFRERMASVYVYKTIYGDYPGHTNMELVEEVKTFEARFQDHSVHGYSRLFLLGFYLKLANIEIQRREDNQFMEIKIPEDVQAFLKLSQVRSEKIDWLILILTHLNLGLGEKLLMNALISGKKFTELYEMMSREAQELMNQNLLAYGASIQESDIFLYEKI
jgi:hypothetical protein